MRFLVELFFKLQRIHSLSFRSLTRFRIALAAIGLIDLAQRALDLSAHYTDLGYFPRAPLLEAQPALHTLYPHFWFGSTIGVAALFAVHTLILFSLGIGYKTRWTTPFAWYLASSLDFRSPDLLTGGDALYRIALFWACFLPLEPSSAKGSEKEVQSGATVGLTVQLALVYLMAGISKLASENWISGRIWPALISLPSRWTSLGQLLVSSDLLSNDRHWIIFSWFFILIEIALGLTLISGTQFRNLRNSSIFAAIGVHLIFMLFLKLGLFPLQAMAVLLVLWIQKKDKPKKHLIGSPLPALFLIPVIAANLSPYFPNLYPAPLREFTVALGLQQDWRLFVEAPDPRIEKRIYANLDNGQSSVIDFPHRHRWTKALEKWKQTTPTPWLQNQLCHELAGTRSIQIEAFSRWNCTQN